MVKDPELSYDELIAAAHEIVGKATWVLDQLVELKERDAEESDPS